MSVISTNATASDRSSIQKCVFVGLAVSALVLAAAARLHSDMAEPLWLDESWTGAIAAQPSVPKLNQQVWDEVNAPIYYYLIWIWAQAFGVSNVALHVPSMILSFAAPVIAWFGLRKSRPLLAVTWAVLLACWVPAIVQSNDARCYALLSCAAILSTLAHLRLLESPSLRRATIWVVSASLVTLVHYHAALLALMQGIALLGLHRGRALRLWPASIAFVPAFAWIGWHSPRIVEFARSDIAWYHLLAISDIPSALVFIFGDQITLSALVAALLVGVTLKPEKKEGDQVDSKSADAALWWVGGTAVAAAVACLAIAMIRPTFTFRYLTPFAPGVLLLIAHWVSSTGKRTYLPSSVLIAGSMITAVIAIVPNPVSAKILYTFEEASAWLATPKNLRLVYFWDNPATPFETRRQVDAVAGFFLRRAGVPVEVIPIYPTSADMNGPVLEAANGDAAVLWMYDTLVHNTRAQNYPPRLASIDPGLECRNFGGLNIGVVACRRRRTGQAFLPQAHQN